MATSRSPEGWIAGAFLYSGRRDPTWQVSEKVAEALQKLWDGMAPAPGAALDASRLGYRGVFLREAEGREWSAFRGLASLKTRTGIEVRTDTAREFEKRILASAPTGLLPEDITSALQ
jgi:hypothetical protein